MLSLRAKHRVEGPKLAVDDLVLLSSDGINWSSLSSLPNAMRPTWLGPFKILSVDETRENYHLDLPSTLQTGRFWPTFHISKLKVFRQRLDVFPSWRDNFDRPIPVDVDAAGQDMFVVDRIVNHKPFGRLKWKLLLGFQGYPDSHNEWQTFDPSSMDDWQVELDLVRAYVHKTDPSLLSIFFPGERVDPAITARPRTNTRRSSRPR